MRKLLYLILILGYSLPAWSGDSPKDSLSGKEIYRNFVSPTGFGLKKGQGYYQNIWIFGNTGGYGITDKFSVNGGLELISTLYGDPLLFLMPKFSFDLDPENKVALGLLYVHIPTDLVNDRRNALLAVSAYTLGTQERNLTVGLGYGTIGGELPSSPILNFSGRLEITERATLITENWVFPGSDFGYLVSAGTRIAGKFLNYDIALMTNNAILDIGLPALPFLGLSLVF